MDGVKILNEISPMSAGVWVSIGLFVAIGILSLLLSIITLDLDKRNRVILILISIISFVFAVVLFFTEYTKPMKYEATIDDNVKISEFEKKYEIVKQRGDIYVIKERESNDE